MSSADTCKSCGQRADLTDGLCTNCQTADAATIGPASTAPPAATGKTQPTEFGDYEIISEIARGGMGVIYRARHRKLNRLAALKMILNGRFSSEEELQRFNIEAEAAAKLDHPGIVPVYEIGEVEGKPFFAMKLIEGGSLADRLAEVREDKHGAVELLMKVARAVHHAHQRGVLHRDLKPANILIDAAGEPLVTDLGLAKNAGGVSQLTDTGAILGTPSYMPPEQAACGNVTTSADVYALGAILYELMTGVPPYRAGTSLETVMKVLEGPPERPSAVLPNVDRDLELICLRCLEREPEERYESAAALADDLEAWLAGRPISIEARSPFARLNRYVRQNRQTVFASLLLVLGGLICAPFALSLAADEELVSVYDQFPAADRPWIFSLTQLPGWINFIAALFLTLVLWPSIGWLNSRVAQPKTSRDAVKYGLLTSSVLTLFAITLIGWMNVARDTAAASHERVIVLTRAIWPVDSAVVEEDGDRRPSDDPNNLFVGLQDVPESERAEIVAARIRSDQIAVAPASIMQILFLAGVFGIPTIYGTVFSQSLVNRATPIWVALLRYVAGWWAATGGVFMAVGTLFGVAQINGGSGNRPARWYEGLFLASICFGFAWLVLRVWKKQTPVEPVVGSDAATLA